MSITHESRACKIEAAEIPNSADFDYPGYNPLDISNNQRITLKMNLNELLAEAALRFLIYLNMPLAKLEPAHAAFTLFVDDAYWIFRLHTILGVTDGKCSSVLLCSGTDYRPSSMFVHAYRNVHNEWRLTQAIVTYTFDEGFKDAYSDHLTAWNFGHETLQELLECTT